MTDLMEEKQNGKGKKFNFSINAKLTVLLIYMRERQSSK